MSTVIALQATGQDRRDAGGRSDREQRSDRKRRSDDGRWSDGTLVEAYLDGDRDALETLCRRHRQRIVWFCRRRTDDPQLAEDLAQEVMIRCVENIEDFDTSRPLWPWLRTIARNIVIDHHRRTDDAPELDPDLGDVRDGEVALTIRLDRIEEQDLLGPVLAQLPDRQRTALELRYRQDWSREEVADYFDITINACDQLLHRARGNAREHYEEEAQTAAAERDRTCRRGVRASAALRARRG